MHISQFLEKFKHAGLKDLLIREEIAQILSDHYTIVFTKEQIKLNNGVLVITASPLVKNDIFIKKQQHLSLFQEKMPKVIIKDIR